ncbi:MAG TPA: M20/M25/M40 family metallo-hydrolase [Pyrinomonadaceae bacterium]|nr:M20/M25/M40 family metallo-hydrolase [Pyrinomonadaceae bacterium]
MTRSPRFLKPLVLTLALFLSFSVSVAQDGRDVQNDARALRSWIALDAPPGWEHLATDVILKSMPGWRRDALGNLILRKGSGSPRRVVACGLDRPGFAVTEITEDGYLRLREVGSVRMHPLWTQFHEGQRIRVLTRAGSVPGVVTVKSTHLQRGRLANAPVTTLDDLWVDVGATSRTDMRRLGIEMLNPVVRDADAWAYGDFVAGPLAGVRVGCAAVASAAAGSVENGETIFLLTTLRSFGSDGLEAALRTLGRVDQVTVVDQSDLQPESIIAVEKKVEKPNYLPESTGLTSVDVLGVKRRYPGSLVESVRVADANALLAVVARAAGLDRGLLRWVALPEITRSKPDLRDQLASTAELLKALADVPAVSGHERPVREAIVRALPEWARSRVTTDGEGNLVLEVGPEPYFPHSQREPSMFIAHQDEVGFEVTNTADDGTVSLRTRGGLYSSLWEGQPALLHFDAPGKEPLRGVFQPRESATTKQPEALTAWFGVDAATLKQLGVVNGLSVTAFKAAARLGATRFTARALDDRAGSTALILAVRRINPATLKHKVIFAWSVREETGLEGAMALARRYGTTVKRVFSVDTFVSSDSPVETTRFAYAPLGQGAVIRGLDNSSVASPAEIARILTIARAQGIPLQVGATNGGTDGSDFVRYGAVHVSLSWPGRYSHSPVEVLDLRDLQALERLIYALATTP